MDYLPQLYLPKVSLNSTLHLNLVILPWKKLIFVFTHMEREKKLTNFKRLNTIHPKTRETRIETRSFE